MVGRWIASFSSDNLVWCSPRAERMFGKLYGKVHSAAYMVIVSTGTRVASRNGYGTAWRVLSTADLARGI